MVTELAPMIMMTPADCDEDKDEDKNRKDGVGKDIV